MESEDVFIKGKKEQCEKLIKLGIWRGIDSNDLRAWLKNFNSPEEKLFAACILDWFVYRNEDHICSMLFDILTRILHNQWRIDKNPLYNENKNPLDLLKSKYGEIGFRYVTSVKREHKDTKSGFRMVNLMNHSMEISDKWNIKAAEINDNYNQGIQTFIFVDDFAGTGDQMCEILNEADINRYDNAYFYVLLCAAHDIAIQKISKTYPQVKVLCSERICSNSNFFENIPLAIFKMATAEEIYNWYVAFMRTKNVPKEIIGGKGNLGILYAFQNSVPNNCLPVLYFHNNNYKRLILKRQ